ncbi:putative lipid II flippase FtsW [Aurantivibrio infirmus]
MMQMLTNPISQHDLRLPTRFEMDWVLLGLVFTLASIGVLMVASASMSLSESYYEDPWYMLKKHCILLAMGTIGAAIIASIPIRFWQQYGWVLLLLTFILLALVLVPGIGRRVNGSQRWFVFGPISIQASEVAKLLMVMFFASYLSRRHEELKTSWQGVVKPMAILCGVVLLLLLEPDFGGSVVLAGAVFAMMFIAGMKLWQFGILIALASSAMAMVAFFSPYRLQRLITFLDPWADQYNSGYQLTQSLIAFGQGEWFGVGLGRSVQKLFYLPDAHTDFIFAIIAEEFGLIGAIVVVALFAAIIYRMLKLSKRAMLHNNGFVSLAAFGIAVLFTTQAFINMGVASGLLPTKGLTLPFVSYGGSSILISCAFIGIILRLDWELLASPTKTLSTKVKTAKSKSGRAR